MTARSNQEHRIATGLDNHLGAKLREIRFAAGMSQVALGKTIGVSFQQVQKYESATNRISASTLYEACQALDVTVASMFEGFEPAKKRPRRS